MVGERVMQCGIPFIIWGASIGPFTRDPKLEAEMVTFLKKVDLITARESLTYDYLRSLGIEENVVRVWDPAFALMPERYSGPEASFVESGDVLGLNVSGLVARWFHDGNLDLMVDEVGAFVEKAAGEGQKVLLVPHVTFRGEDIGKNDEEVLQMVLDKVKNNAGRVRLLPGTMPSRQIKWVISKCRYFIGARTHSTIAAISSGVPTVAIAYSVKARGIWRDVFGDESLVLPTNQMSVGSLYAKYDELRRREKELRDHLAEKHADMMAGARRNAEALAKLLKIKQGEQAGA